MSSESLRRGTQGSVQWSRRAGWGLGAAAAAAALIAYAAYGDPHPNGSQESAVPILIALALGASVVAFGIVAPLATRSFEHAPRWAIAISTIGLLSVAAFWSGMPIVFGACGVFIARDSRPSSSRLARTASVVGCLAIAACITATVLGNTVLS